MGLPSIYTEKRPSSFDVKPKEKALPNEPQIDKLMNKYIHSLGSYVHAGDRVPGAAVMVRKNNEVVHMNCYGYANLETEQKITIDTIFDLGSLSKQFTAIAALNLVISGELKQADSLAHFFANFPRYAEDVTVDDLIHHTSAIPEYIDLHDASRKVDKDWYNKALKTSDDWYPQMAKRKGEDEAAYTNKDVLGWIASQRLLPKKPNTEFSYSNSGYVVLAELVEKVAAERLATNLQRQVFEPLEMNSTYVFDETSDFAEDAPEVVNHARCYNRVKDMGFVPVGYTPLNFVYGDGNIQSNIVDMAKWDAHLHRLDFASTCARAEWNEAANKIRDLLWEPIHTKSRRRINYGAGWNLFRHEYEETVEENGKQVTRKYESHGEYHRGEWLGWRSYIARGARWVAPKRGKEVDPNTWESLGIVMLSNSNQFNIDLKVQQISEIYWGTVKKNNIMERFY